MIRYGILAWGNTKFNKGKRDFFVIDANDDKEVYRKFKKEHPEWIPNSTTAMYASISKELTDVLKTDNDPIMVETLQSALKTYDEATETDVMMGAINIAKSLLKIKLPGCPALEHLIERELNGKIMSEVEDALRERGMLA